MYHVYSNMRVTLLHLTLTDISLDCFPGTQPMSDHLSFFSFWAFILLFKVVFLLYCKTLSPDQLTLFSHSLALRSYIFPLILLMVQSYLREDYVVGTLKINNIIYPWS